MGSDALGAEASNIVEPLLRLAPNNPGFAELVGGLAARQRRSLAWHARAQHAAAGLPSQLPYESPLLPLYVDHVAGGRVVDVDGNTYIDCDLGYTASILGDPPETAAAVRDAIEAGVGPGLPTPAQVRLCELVCALTGCGRAALFHTGGEALMAAVRVARAATGRVRVAKFEGCYHGATDLGLHASTMLLSGQPPRSPANAMAPEPATAGLDPAVADSLLVLPFGEQRAIDLIGRHADELAAVVVDPAPPFAADRLAEAAAFVRALATTTAGAGVPLVADEVVTGFRLARGGAQEAFGFRANLACYGKVVSGAGMALSVLAGDADLLDRLRTDGVLADYAARKAWATSTFSAGSAAVAAAVERLALLAAGHREAFAAIDAGQAQLRAAVAAIADDLGVPVAVGGHPRLRPMLVIGDRGPPPATGQGEGWYRQALRGATATSMRSLLAATLYLRRYGVYAKSSPTLATSAAHTSADVSQIADAIGHAVARMRRDGIVAPACG